MRRMYTYFFMIACTVLLLIGCAEKETVVCLKNPLDIQRNNELVRVEIEDLEIPTNQLIVVDQEDGKQVACQVIDADGNQLADAVLFQTSLDASASKYYALRCGESEIEESNVKTYARFVPERTDDFTWENDKVAFRTYGPKAQQMVEEGTAGGTLSSGIDCWLKRVNYSIIDDWYKGNTKKAGFYHIDHGQGLDNYHVGPSRGCGGTGVMVDDVLCTSKNFISYDVLENGPLESTFSLDYAPYKAGDKKIIEKKTISIALGSHFTKYTIHVKGTEMLTVGVTLHENHGEVSTDEANGWINYFAPHFGTTLSTSVVALPAYFDHTSLVESEVADQSHVLMHLKVIDGKVEFYSGFNWSKSGYFENNQTWEAYLTTFSSQIQNPIIVTIQ